MDGWFHDPLRRHVRPLPTEAERVQCEEETQKSWYDGDGRKQIQEHFKEEQVKSFNYFVNLNL